jgi:hypothetical protein
MQSKFELEVIRVDDDWGRAQALSVMRATYRDDKGWLAREESLVARDELRSGNVSWFVARLDQQPVSVLRVLYSPPLDLKAGGGFRPLSDLDLETFSREHRIAEIGRFAAVPPQRRNFLVAAALMRAACTETIRRGCSHYITDVSAGEKDRPHSFHTRVMGFEAVATQDAGELNCPNRRVTLLLSLRDAYHRLRTKGGWLFNYLTESWDAELHAVMSRTAKVLDVSQTNSGYDSFGNRGVN